MRGGLVGQLGLATVCSVLTVYVSLRPELIRQKEEREGVFEKEHTERPVEDDAVSKAMASDFAEARQQLQDSTKGGFAWGIRKAMFGDNSQQTKESMTASPIEAAKKAEAHAEPGK